MKKTYSIIRFLLFLCIFSPFLLNMSNAQTVSFNEVGATAGVNDSGGGCGVAWGDYDNDGDIDLYVVNAGRYTGINRLYQNNGDGSFSEVGALAGVNNSESGRGCAFGDFDNDGYIDLYVTNALKANLLYRNNGDGTFSNIASSAGVNDFGNGSGIAWGDYNNDGYLDLHVTNFGQANRLYQNNGDMTFEEVGSIAGVNDSGGGHSGAWADYDNDGHIDLYVVNYNANNRLYKNNGDETFRDVSIDAGVNDGSKGIGMVWGDYDNDGDIDLYVVNQYSANLLYQNIGNGTFEDIANAAGVGDDFAGKNGHSADFGDYDNDGDLDLYVSHDGGINRLYHNNGDGTFNEEGNELGLDDDGPGGGVAWGDYDNDGDLDLYLARYGGSPNRLYQNINSTLNNWIIIKLIGTMSNKDGIGSKITVDLGASKLYRHVLGGTGFQAQLSLLAEVGLGNATQIEKICVEWPSGINQVIRNIDVNQYITIIESSNQSPTANAGSDLIKEADQQNGTEIPLTGSESSDADNDPLTYTWRENGNILAGPTSDPISNVVLTLGIHDIDLTVDDGKGGTDTDDVIIEIVDTTPPALTIELDPTFLWPPNHKMVNISATVVVNDICDPDPSWTLLSIESNEPEEGPGKKNYPDIEGDEPGTDDTEFKLRAERLGNGDGRIYTITYQVTDVSGNANSLNATVVVPHDMGKPLALDPNESSKTFELLGNYPNPFNPETQISYQIPKDNFVSLKIFNYLGQEIRTLVTENQQAGNFSVLWDGRDDSGNLVGSGFYFYVLQAGEFRETKKALLLR